MDQNRLKQAAQQLQQEGWTAKLDGDRLICRHPRGMDVEVLNQEVPRDAEQWEEMLNIFVEALLEAAVEEKDE